MKVFVNSDEIEIFGGATVKDALRRFFLKKCDKNEGNFIVRDQWDHEMDIDAPLREGMKITIDILEE